MTDRSQLDGRESIRSRKHSSERGVSILERNVDSPSKRIEPQQVYLDSFLIDRARIAVGWSLKQLAVEAEISYRTLRSIFNRDGVLPATALQLAEAIGKNVLELLAPYDPRYVAPAVIEGPWAGSAEWISSGYLEQGRLAPNGLYYIVCKMQHRHSRTKLGRGKFYHLSWLPAATRESLQEKLSRHAEVSARVGSHRHVAVNHTSTPVRDGHGWWVIDEWVGERTLADHLQSGPFPHDLLPRLLHDMALGLQTLHTAKIVARELAPARVLISDRDGHAVLTDFELAKLLDGSPSVSSDWPEDMFRAPEIDGGSATVQSDLYSFGQVVLASIGQETAAGLEQSASALAGAGVPQRLSEHILCCLEPIPSRRPTTLLPILLELSRWSEKR